MLETWEAEFNVRLASRCTVGDGEHIVIAIHTDPAGTSTFGGAICCERRGARSARRFNLCHKCIVVKHCTFLLSPLSSGRAGVDNGESGLQGLTNSVGIDFEFYGDDQVKRRLPCVRRSSPGTTSLW